jgi:hypothetical protein
MKINFNTICELGSIIGLDPGFKFLLKKSAKDLYSLISNSASSKLHSNKFAYVLLINLWTGG